MQDDMTQYTDEEWERARANVLPVEVWQNPATPESILDDVNKIFGDTFKVTEINNQEQQKIELEIEDLEKKIRMVGILERIAAGITILGIILGVLMLWSKL